MTTSFEAVGLEGDATFFTVVVVGFLAAVLATGDLAVGDLVVGDLVVGDLVVGDLVAGDLATGDFGVGEVAAAVAAATTPAAPIAAVAVVTADTSAPSTNISDSMAARLSSDTGLKASACRSGI